MHRLRALARWCGRNAPALAMVAGVGVALTLGVVLFTGGQQTVAAPGPIPAPTTTTRPGPERVATTTTSTGSTTTTTKATFVFPTTTTIDTSRDQEIAGAALLQPMDVGPGWQPDADDPGIVDTMFLGGGACAPVLLAFNVDVTGKAIGDFDSGHGDLASEVRVFGSEAWAAAALEEFGADSTAECLRNISAFGNGPDDGFTVERTDLGGQGAAWRVRMSGGRPDSSGVVTIDLVAMRSGRVVALLVAANTDMVEGTPSVPDLVAALAARLP